MATTLAGLQTLAGERQERVAVLIGEGHIPYIFDGREQDQPSLLEMTESAVSLLSQDPDGSFLMVEAGRIIGPGVKRRRAVARGELEYRRSHERSGAVVCGGAAGTRVRRIGRRHRGVWSESECLFACRSVRKWSGGRTNGGIRHGQSKAAQPALCCAGVVAHGQVPDDASCCRDACDPRH